MKNYHKTLAIIIVILFSSCSTMKIGYNWADYLLYKRIDKWFDINSDQEDFIDSNLKKIHFWHRNEELPKYRDYLEKIRKKVEMGNISQEDVKWLSGEIRKYFQSIASFAKPDSVKFLYSLSEEQIQYFEKKISERNKEEALKLNRDLKKRYEDAMDKAVEDVENWTGELSSEQRKEVVKVAFFKKEEAELRLKNQMRSQKRFIKILRDKGNFEDFKKSLNDWFFNYRRFHSEAYSKVLSEKREAGKKLILLMDRIATEKQRAHTIEKIGEYIVMIDELMAKDIK